MIPDTRLTPRDFAARKTQPQHRKRAARTDGAKQPQAMRAEHPPEDELFTADSSSDVGKFFAEPTDAVAESHALWDELHAHQQNAPRRKLHRGMIWTLAIALLGLLLNGGFLLYHKLWMPEPVELDARPPTLLLPGAMQEQSSPAP